MGNLGALDRQHYHPNNKVWWLSGNVFFYQTTHGFSIGDVNGLIAYLGVLFLIVFLLLSLVKGPFVIIYVGWPHL